MSRRPPGFEVSSINSFNRKGVPQMETEIGRNTSDVGDCVVKLGTTVDVSELVAGGVMQTSELIKQSEVL